MRLLGLISKHLIRRLFLPSPRFLFTIATYDEYFWGSEEGFLISTAVEGYVVGHLLLWFADFSLLLPCEP